MWAIFRRITDLEYAQRDLENYAKIGAELEIEKSRIEQMITENKVRMAFLIIEIEEMKK